MKLVIVMHRCHNGRQWASSVLGRDPMDARTLIPIAIGVVQVAISLPHLSELPWRSLGSLAFSRHLLDWCFDGIKPGVAMYFIPALAMALAGALAVVVGVAQRTRNWLIEAAICCEMFAIGTLLVMDFAAPAAYQLLISGGKP